ncbi:MAG: RluA family pseudouridine synthase [Ignavibacteriae bacterium HGW-Ignavibacteriae-3]|nr:MAG: RluA family pseudouridine synthase [Ignavibacteriae bacterium HGW-Ignavibacteriae-3]
MIDADSIEILFENEDLLAANKPEGISSITENDTTLNSLHSLLEKKIDKKLFIVHRLDKEVSGVILFAKNSRTHKFLNDQFAERKVKKYYTALVIGVIKENEGIIRKPIREFGSGRMGIDDRKGKPSETKFRVVQRFKDYTLLELNPSTGRRHQLRVHLYSIGYPIVGDVRYGDKTVQEKYSRIMLHAKSLEFQLSNGNNEYVEAPFPSTFSETLSDISDS